MRYIHVIFFMLLLILGWTFGAQNSEVLGYPVTFRIQLWLLGIESFPIPLGAILVLGFFLGGVGASIFVLGRELKLRRELMSKKSQIRQLEREIKDLRDQVLSEPVEETDMPQLTAAHHPADVNADEGPETYNVSSRREPNP